MSDLGRLHDHNTDAVLDRLLAERRAAPRSSPAVSAHERQHLVQRMLQERQGSATGGNPHRHARGAGELLSPSSSTEDIASALPRAPDHPHYISHTRSPPPPQITHRHNPVSPGTSQTSLITNASPSEAHVTSSRQQRQTHEAHNPVAATLGPTEIDASLLRDSRASSPEHACESEPHPARDFAVNASHHSLASSCHTSSIDRSLHFAADLLVDRNAHPSAPGPLLDLPLRGTAAERDTGVQPTQQHRQTLESCATLRNWGDAATVAEGAVESQSRLQQQGAMPAPPQTRGRQPRCSASPGRGKRALSSASVAGGQQAHASEGPTSKSPNRHSRQAVLDEVMAERASVLTYKPQLNQRSLRWQNKATDLTGNRIETLAMPRSDAKYQQRKQEAVDAELTECTFAPRIKRRPSSAPHHRDRSLPASVRLYHAHDHVKTKRDRAQAQAMESELAQCTFAPKIGYRHLKQEEYVPIHERVNDLLRKKNERLTRTRLDQELQDPNATFAPALNQRSVRIAQAKKAKAVSQSLTSAPDSRAALSSPAFCSAAGRRRSVSPHHERCLEPADTRDCTFAPAVNPNTESRLMNAGIPTNFEQRQAYYRERRKIKVSQAQRDAEDRECTFRPDTANPIAVLAGSSKAPHLQETRREFLERLTGDGARKQIVLQAIENVQMSKYTFRPTINRKSRAIARSKGVDELSRHPRRQLLQEEARCVAEQRLQQQCTFQPNVRKAHSVGDGSAAAAPKAAFSVSAAAPEELVERMNAYKEQKSRRLNDERSRRQYEELNACTFTPAIHPAPAPTAGRVLVRGLSNHLEKQKLAAKKAEEQQRREAQVFLTNPKQPKVKFTIAKPFALSTDDSSKLTKKAELRQQLLEEAMKECTFRPRTNENERRQIIDKLLAADTPVSCI